MKRGGIGAFAVGSIAAVVLGTAGASAQDASLKQLMGENFAGLQSILVALITSNYAAVPAQVDIIEQHAAELTHTVPENAKAQQGQFLTYAYNLKGHAADLKSIADLLIEHDKVAPPGKPLGTDQLREAAAAHYGGMVTTCVACHNRFRPRMVQ